ncbi:hypothetical protein ASG31_09250 [Chryseobacterium sp. Leaf404]|uniref:T9SS type A sorting domain-containing protein n=1 Tax=unclassified Chryseobacterium TaxID=2593645 RepID=UPI0006F30CC6|nr:MULTISPECIES: T9SS type A sorting domain-containing protein [unclassified Chryseobacterium]KQT17576.1 hypothetical protein ASG31_09250 [Chryseobacterium sp. Leaf404]
MPYAIQQTTDGGYVVVGESSSVDGDITNHHGTVGTYSDIWVVKLSNTGNIEWQKSLGGSSVDIGSSIMQTADGGYIIGGSTMSNNGDITVPPVNYSNYWIVKIDSMGIIQWDKTLGNISGYDYSSSIRQTIDGGYIVAGVTDAVSGDVTSHYGGNDTWIVKLSSNGVIQWQKSYGGSGNDIPQSIIQTNDGGYIFAGSSQSNDGDVSGHHGSAISYDAWIVKLNVNGIIQWQKSLGGTGGDGAYSIKEMPNGGYTFAGYSSSTDGDTVGNSGGSGNFWIVRINNVGNIIWQKSMGGSLLDYGQSMSQTTDGGFIMNGRSFSDNGDVSFHYGNPTYSDIWVVKVAPEVLSTDEKEYEKFNIYPNPATEKLFISDLFSDEKYEIYSVTGQMVKTGKTSQSSVDVHDLAKGIYFVEIKNIKQKFIKK